MEMGFLDLAFTSMVVVDPAPPWSILSSFPLEDSLVWKGYIISKGIYQTNITYSYFKELDN